MILRLTGRRGIQESLVLFTDLPHLCVILGHDLTFCVAEFPNLYIWEQWYFTYLTGVLWDQVILKCFRLFRRKAFTKCCKSVYTFVVFENGVYGRVDEYFACGHRRWIWFECYSAEEVCHKQKCRASCLKNTTYLFLFLKGKKKKSVCTLEIRKATQFNQAGWISAEVTFIFYSPVLL